MLNDSQILKLNSAPGIYWWSSTFCSYSELCSYRQQVNKNSTITYTFCKVMETKCSFLYKNNFYHISHFIHWMETQIHIVLHELDIPNNESQFSLWYEDKTGKFIHNILLHSFEKQYSHLKVTRHQQWFTLPDNTTPLCRTSSIFWTIILCTSCNSVLIAERLRRARESVNTFLAFWMYVSETFCTY
jgi:hypothetical protein